MNFIKSHPVIFTVVILDIVAIIIVIIIAANNASKTATLDLLVTPADATVSINGTNYANGTYKLKPSTTTAVISKDGFEPKTIDVTFESDATTKLHAYLIGTDNDFSYYLQHRNDFYNLQQIATTSDNYVKELFNYVEQKQSIAQQLPVVEWVYEDPASNSATGGFKISDGSNAAGCSWVLCLQVTYYYKGYSDKIIPKIKELGYNPDDYQIIYQEVNYD